MAPKTAFYAIQKGPQGPTVANTWAECQRQVHGFCGAVYRKFSTYAQAVEFANAGKANTPGVPRTPATLRGHSGLQPASTLGDASPEFAASALRLEEGPPVATDTDGTLYFDGGSRGNPGVAGSGAVLYDTQSNRVWQGYKYLGRDSTNNQAEYTGLIMGLRAAKQAGMDSVTAFGDSKLVVEQMNGNWKVNHSNMKTLHREACEVARTFQKVRMRHVLREHNSEADKLANSAMDVLSDRQVWFRGHPNTSEDGSGPSDLPSQTSGASQGGQTKPFSCSSASSLATPTRQNTARVAVGSEPPSLTPFATPRTALLGSAGWGGSGGESNTYATPLSSFSSCASQGGSTAGGSLVARLEGGSRGSALDVRPATCFKALLYLATYTQGPLVSLGLVMRSQSLVDNDGSRLLMRVSKCISPADMGRPDKSIPAVIAGTCCDVLAAALKDLAKGGACQYAMLYSTEAAVVQAQDKASLDCQGFEDEAYNFQSVLEQFTEVKVNFCTSIGDHAGLCAACSLARIAANSWDAGECNHGKKRKASVSGLGSDECPVELSD